MDIGQNINGLFFMSNLDEFDISVIMVGLEMIKKRTLIPEEYKERSETILKTYKSYCGVDEI